jgi:hypothetical protein
MRAGLWIVLLALWPLAGLAQVNRPFAPDRWPSQDLRYLQAALVWSGDYVGLIDGDWGGRSDAALDAWAARAGAPRTEAGLRPLLADFAARSPPRAG